MDDIQVSYLVSSVDEDTTLVTAATNEEWIRDHSMQILRSALEQNGDKGQSSVIVPDTSNKQTLTLAQIDTWASGLNANRTNLLLVNAAILEKILTDGFLGRAYESVVSNINTDYKLSYGDHEDESKNAKSLAEVKQAIEYFNRSVNLKKLIRSAISGVYAEGNYVMYLREADGTRPVIDHYPLRVAYPSDYLWNGEHVIEFDVTTLKSALQKTYPKTRKNKAVYFENIQKEIDANYPKEVSKAYKDNEKIVRLDPRYSGCAKYNDLDRKFGVSPLFRCLKPLIVLQNIETADVSDSTARSKKIIFQKLRKELMGQDGTRKGFAEAAHAHEQAAQALKTSFGLYTAAPFVEDMSYVQAKAQSDDAINQQKQYTQKLLTALGIGFTDIDATVGATQISVKQLLKTVNAIGESVETIIHKFYETYLEDLGLDPAMAPDIRIIDSEQMEMDVRRDLASFVFGTLGGSRATAYEILGMNVYDEKKKREVENDEKYDDIFFPHPVAYTSASNNGAGRPSGSGDTDKQVYDQTYTEQVRN